VCVCVCVCVHVWQGECVELDQDGNPRELYTRWAVASSSGGTYKESAIRTGDESWTLDVQGHAVPAPETTKTVVEGVRSRTTVAGRDNALITYFYVNQTLQQTRLVSFRETAGVVRRIVSTQSFSDGFQPSGLSQCHDKKLINQAEADHALASAGLPATLGPEIIAPVLPDSGARYQPDLCNASTVNLADYPQWADEHGYWVGHYSYFGGDMAPNYAPENHNYPYDHYRGFITGSVYGSSYSQRNVFMYPPQTSKLCAANNSTFIKGEICGSTGGVKIFKADQTTEYCDRKDGGRISGPYGKDSTTTTLVGDQVVLYQIWSDNSKGESVFYQSQMTTITKSKGHVRRTHTAQFWDKDTGTAQWFSFYRETKTSENDFWTQLNAVRKQYNVSDASIDAICSGGMGNLKKFLMGSMDWDGDKYSCPIPMPQSGGTLQYAVWTKAGVSGWGSYYPNNPMTEGKFITSSQLAQVPGATVDSLVGYGWVDTLSTV